MDRVTIVEQDSGLDGSRDYRFAWGYCVNPNGQVKAIDRITVLEENVAASSVKYEAEYLLDDKDVLFYVKVPQNDGILAECFTNRATAKLSKAQKGFLSSLLESFEFPNGYNIKVTDYKNGIAK